MQHMDEICLRFLKFWKKCIGLLIQASKNSVTWKWCAMGCQRGTKRCRERRPLLHWNAETFVSYFCGELSFSVKQKADKICGAIGIACRNISAWKILQVITNKARLLSVFQIESSKAKRWEGLEAEVPAHECLWSSMERVEGSLIKLISKGYYHDRGVTQYPL